MLKKRVIFTLLYDNGSFMLSRNFRLQKVGNLNWLQRNYNFSQIAFFIDELVVLDVSRQDRDEDRFCDHIMALTEGCFVPIAAGGGVRSLEYARKLLRSGADKIVVNSLLATDVNEINSSASEFGRQCLVASVDVNQDNTIWVNNGGEKLDVDARDWLHYVVNELPIGELYLNSMERDGTGQGYMAELLDLLPDSVPVPVILAGGAGKHQHFMEGLHHTKVNAVATAHLFNFVGNGLELARNGLLSEGIDLPCWDAQVAIKLKQCCANGESFRSV